MDIEYYGCLEGQKFYEVKRGNGKAIFLGTMGECRRFIQIRREKVRKHLAQCEVLSEEVLDLLVREL